MKILIALSGGIDSSTVAHMLAEQGHDLVGVRFTLWSDPLAPPLATVLPSKCCSAATAARAKRTAEALGIPYHVVDMEKEFKTAVVDPFLEGYRKGLTPNPCIGCNRTIKFGKLLELMQEFGCERLATGHYARVARERLPDGTERHLLLEAVDQAKDQSYYLYGLTQEQLQKVLFPLGAMQKREVFALAAHYGVPFEEESYRESQDLCFFPEKEPKEFLKRHLRDALKPGGIVRRDGTVVGTHDGLALYTIGQRRGLKVGGLKIPLEVVAKDASTNQIIVAPQGSETIESVELRDLHWISWMPPFGRASLTNGPPFGRASPPGGPSDEPNSFDCRVRSLSPRLRGHLSHNGTSGSFRFSFPQPRIAPGQSLVLYRGGEIVGGGVMIS